MRKLVATYTDAVVRGDVDWAQLASATIKANLKMRGLTYAELVERLAKLGVKETEPNVRNKLSRGTFSATFMLQCMVAIGNTMIRLDDVFDQEITYHGNMRPPEDR